MVNFRTPIWWLSVVEATYWMLELRIKIFDNELLDTGFGLSMPETLNFKAANCHGQQLLVIS
jgi:hypothetical protein